MKFLETHFDEYLQAAKKYSLHPTLSALYDKYPATRMPNTIFYGPPGVGKYTQALVALKKYSPSELKYEKRMLITYDNAPIYIKMSDIHFEVNMAMLGCNSKFLWNEIYTQIIDVISTRPQGYGIIMCKNFHHIHSELLDVFYSYFRCSNPKIHISFVIMTDNLSFIASSIVNSCEVIHMKRPPVAHYKRCLASFSSNSTESTPAPTPTPTPAPNIITLKNLPQITNIKGLRLNRRLTDASATAHNNTNADDGDALFTVTAAADNAGPDANMNSSFRSPHLVTCTRIFDCIVRPETINLLELRDVLYDILICDLDIYHCIWFLLDNLLRHCQRDGIAISKEVMADIIINTYTFLHMFNNNYRPIYHLERFVFMLINHVKKLAPAHPVQVQQQQQHETS
jgi:hypothetical protein